MDVKNLLGVELFQAKAIIELLQANFSDVIPFWFSFF